MTNSQVRMLSSVLAILSGAILSLSNNIDVKVSIFLILLGGMMFVAEYVRSQKQ